MNGDGVVPEVIDDSPPLKLCVSYPGGAVVDFGEELKPEEVAWKPTVFWKADPNKYYVLIMIDADSPSRKDPKFREVLHWLLVNIKGNNLSSGQTIAEYAGSGPPKGSGLHRYVFVLYEQEDRIEFKEPFCERSFESLKFRKYFSCRAFAQKYNLGEPLAGNYFQAQWDPYLERLKKVFLEIKSKG